MLGHTQKGKQRKWFTPLGARKEFAAKPIQLCYFSIFLYDTLHPNKIQVTIFISNRQTPLHQDNGVNRHCTCMISFPTSVFYFLNNTDCKSITCPVFQTLPGWFPSALCRIHSVLCARWAAQTCEILIPALQWMYWEAQQEIQLKEFNVEKVKYTCIGI